MYSLVERGYQIERWEHERAIWCRESLASPLFLFLSRERDGAAASSLSLFFFSLSLTSRPPKLNKKNLGPTADNILTSASGGRRSLNPGNRPLLTAYISCRGPKPLVMHAGPALAPFAGNFSGVEYVKEVQLPGGAIEIRGQDVTIENSFFVNLNYMVREIGWGSFLCFISGERRQERG